MARTVISLVKDVWTPLTAGELIITIHEEGSQGQLRFNTVTGDDANALRISRGHLNEQVAQNNPAQQAFVKATGDNWKVAEDT